ncbi:hypothetical protein ACFVT5_37180 [Streptomyces sp. NPDC058001]
MDFYAGLGFTLSPDGNGIPTPLGFNCHGPMKGFCGYAGEPRTDAVRV